MERTINTLESEVERERAEKEELRSKLELVLDDKMSVISRQSTSRNRDSTQSTQSMSSMRSAGVSSFTTASTDEGLSTVCMRQPVVDWHRMSELEVKIRVLESELEKEREPKEELEYQNEITELKLSNQSLREENQTLRSQLKTHQRQAKSHKSKVVQLERALAANTSTWEASQADLGAIKREVMQLGESKLLQDKKLASAHRDNEELRTRVKVLEADLLESQGGATQAETQLQGVKKEIDMLKLQTYEVGLQAARDKKLAAQKIAALERSCRRSDSTVEVLEASLQDLKISLEEKAMENDELSRSIQRVMEHANETIEGAKHRSVMSAMV